MLIGMAFAVILGAVGGLFPAQQCGQKRNPDGAAGNLTGSLIEGQALYGRGTQESANRPDASGAPAEPSKWATRWIIAGVLFFLLLGAWRFASEKLNAAPVVEVQRVRSAQRAAARRRA